jgi:hypothetical protein
MPLAASRWPSRRILKGPMMRATLKAHKESGLSTNPAVAYDVYEIRKDFPILGREVHGKPLVYSVWMENACM